MGDRLKLCVLARACRIAVTLRLVELTWLGRRGVCWRKDSDGWEEEGEVNIRLTCVLVTPDWLTTGRRTSATTLGDPEVVVDSVCHRQREELAHADRLPSTKDGGVRPLGQTAGSGRVFCECQTCCDRQ